MARWRIGYVGPSLSHPLSRALWQGLLRAAREQDDDLVLLSGGFINGIDKEANPSASSFRFACAPFVDGLVVYGAPFGQFYPLGEVRRVLSTFPVPLVNIGLKVEGFPCVEIDDAQGLAALVSHLAGGHGYRRFAWIGGPPENQETILRCTAVRTALGQEGLELDPADCVPGDYSPAAGRQGVRCLLDDRGRNPEVIVCVDDDTAVGAVQELERRGLRVPGDVAVTGFDDSALARSTLPALSTVHQDLEAEGAAAGALLHQILAGGPGNDVRIPTRPVVRESCGCLAGQASGEPDGVLADALAEVWAASGDGSGGFSAAALRTLFFQGAGGNTDRFFGALGTVRDRLALRGTEPEPRAWDRWVSRVYQGAAGLAVQQEVAREVATEERYAVVTGLSKELSSVTDESSLATVLRGIVETFDLDGLCITLREGAGERVLFRHPPDLGGPGALFQRVSDRPAAGKLLIVEPLASGDRTLGFLEALLPVSLVFLGDILASSLGATLTRLGLIGQIRLKTERLEETVRNLESTKRRLVQAERLAALGQMVFGVAHELNTPLGNILASASSLEDRLREVSRRFQAGQLGRSEFDQFLQEAGEGLTLLQRNNGRAISLVQQFKRLGLGEGAEEPQAFDLAVLAGDLVRVQELRFRQAGLVLDRRLPASCPLLSYPQAFVQILEQALDNVLVHAYPPGTPGWAEVFLEARGAGLWALGIRDRGRGLDEEALARIFDPFYTDKRTQGRLGLGAHLLHNLAALLLGGQVVAESRAGEGLTLTVLFSAEPAGLTGS